MFNRKDYRHSTKGLVFALLTVGMLAACGQKQDESVVDVDSVYDGHEETIVLEQELSEMEEETAEVSESDEATTTNEVVTTDGAVKEDETAKSKQLKRQFGSNCITEQTFEVELSEYDGKVWFVPYAPSGEGDFHMQIIQDGEVLEDISGYVPEKLEGQDFGSLDAVAFFDVNYDNNTDIVLIETYGDTSFVAVYYGDVDIYSDDYVWVDFDCEQQLSAGLTNSVEQLTIPVIRDFLGNGKKNGEFADYREAYLAVAKLREMEGNEEIKYKYNLIYFDDDDIPELVEDDPGYYVSLYTYHDGKIYTLMDRWGYGAGGNHGYDYCPRKSSVRNYDADYAGLILHTTYWTLGDGYKLDRVVSIEFLNFIDANENGRPDGDEEETAGYGDKIYIDGVEITPEKEMSYSMGEYEWLGASRYDMNLEDLVATLN